MGFIDREFGLNSKLTASAEKTDLALSCRFDGNGSADPLIFHYMGETLVFIWTRDIWSAISLLKRKHSSTADYAKAAKPLIFSQLIIFGKSWQEGCGLNRSGTISTDRTLFLFPLHSLPVSLSKTWAGTKSTCESSIAGNFIWLRVDLGKNTAMHFRLSIKDGILGDFQSEIRFQTDWIRS